MKKFMVLYMANAAEFERMMKESTPEQQKKLADMQKRARQQQQPGAGQGATGSQNPSQPPK